MAQALTKVRLKLNLGSLDLAALGLESKYDLDDVTEGKVIDVNEATADKLVNGLKCAEYQESGKRGRAVEEEPAKATTK